MNNKLIEEITVHAVKRILKEVAKDKVKNRSITRYVQSGLPWHISTEMAKLKTNYYSDSMCLGMVLSQLGYVLMNYPEEDHYYVYYNRNKRIAVLFEESQPDNNFKYSENEIASVDLEAYQFNTTDDFIKALRTFSINKIGNRINTKQI